MSAEASIALGVAGRVLANIACAHNPRLGAGLVGFSTGLLLHRAYLANTLLDPFTLLVLAAGMWFDHSIMMYSATFEGVVTELLACGLGVVLADFGPDLWYELGCEGFGKEIGRELEAMGLPVGGVFGDAYYDSASDDDRSDVEYVSVVSRRTASSRRTAGSRSALSRATSATVRPSRPRPTAHPASTITRLSRVTFDESSITQSLGSDDADAEDWLTITNGDALSGGGSGGADDLYMEPSTASTSSRTTSAATVRPQTARRPSILRRLNIPGQEATTTTLPSTSYQSSSIHTRLMSDGETTPRAATRPDFTPLTPPSGFEPPISSLPSGVGPSGPSFPEPDLSSSTTNGYTHTHDEYSFESPKIVPPSEATPDLSASIALPEPVYLPNPFPEASPSDAAEYREEKHEDHDHGPSRFSQIMNVPIVPPTPTPEEQMHHHKYEENGHFESPDSAKLWAPREPSASRRSRSGSRSRSRSRSPAGPRPQPPSQHGSPPPPMPSQPIASTSGPAFPSYISETFDDSTVDVRELPREAAILRIEEAWKHVEKKRQRRLNVLVRHDDDELQTSARKNSTFHLMEDLENLRFNFKIRPGIIMITSRSRG